MNYTSTLPFGVSQNLNLNESKRDEWSREKWEGDRGGKQIR